MRVRMNREEPASGAERFDGRDSHVRNVCVSSATAESLANCRALTLNLGGAFSAAAKIDAALQLSAGAA